MMAQQRQQLGGAEAALREKGSIAPPPAMTASACASPALSCTTVSTSAPEPGDTEDLIGIDELSDSDFSSHLSGDDDASPKRSRRGPPRDSAIFGESPRSSFVPSKASTIPASSSLGGAPPQKKTAVVRRASEEWRGVGQRLAAVLRAIDDEDDSSWGFQSRADEEPPCEEGSLRLWCDVGQRIAQKLRSLAASDMPDTTLCASSEDDCVLSSSPEPWRTIFRPNKPRDDVASPNADPQGDERWRIMGVRLAAVFRQEVEELDAAEAATSPPSVRPWTPGVFPCSLHAEVL